jgi:hypothetical protein
MKEHYRQIEDFFARLVSEGQKNGTFNKSISPQAAAWQFCMSGIGYAMVSLNLGMIDRATVNQVIEATLRGLKN